VLYRRLADFVVVIHWLAGGFFLFGAFFAREHPWIALVHIPLAIWISAAFIMGWTCPLTPLENRLRKAAGERGYQGNFVDHYLGMNSPPDTAVPIKKRRKREVILGAFFCLFASGSHGANLDEYRDAIWPPESKPPREFSAP
jgi:hypothetical protein